MNRLGSTSVGLCHRLAYATALAALTWCMTILPLGLKHLAMWSAVIAVVNAPVSAVGLSLSCQERGLDIPFGDCHDPSSPHLLKHLRLAIPVYVVLFYFPGLIRGGMNWWRGRRGPVGDAAL